MIPKMSLAALAACAGLWALSTPAAAFTSQPATVDSKGNPQYVDPATKLESRSSPYDKDSSGRPYWDYSHDSLGQRSSEHGLGYRRDNSSWGAPMLNDPPGSR